MPTGDPFGILNQVEHTPIAAPQHITAPKQPVAPGPTNFWGRLVHQGQQLAMGVVHESTKVGEAGGKLLLNTDKSLLKSGNEIIHAPANLVKGGIDKLTGNNKAASVRFNQARQGGSAARKLGQSFFQLPIQLAESVNPKGGDVYKRSITPKGGIEQFLLGKTPIPTIQKQFKDTAKAQGKSAAQVQAAFTVFMDALGVKGGVDSLEKARVSLKGTKNVTPATKQVIIKNAVDSVKKGESPDIATAVQKSIAEKIKGGVSTAPKPKLLPKMDESGAVNPGEAVKDIKTMVAKHQATTKYSGDIQRGGDMVEGAKKAIANDAVNIAKKFPKLSKEDLQTVQDYRDNKEAGLKTPELPEHLKSVNDDITTLNKAAESAKVERGKLEGKEYTSSINPETYIHREAAGKNSVFDNLSIGSKRSAMSGQSFGKRIASDKGRVFKAITDENGNRQVVAVKNSSFGKVKSITAFDKQTGKQLGKFAYDDKTQTLTKLGTNNGLKKGNTYKLGEATQKEITASSGQKYYVHPLLTSLKNYIDARTAVENVKYIDSIKNHPDFEKFATEPDETAPKNYEKVNGLMQFQGYKFEPKVAEGLRDIVKSNSGDEKKLLDTAGNFLKKTIVYFPLKHNLNQTATYAVDRGFSWLNPIAAKRMASSIVSAFHEVTNQGPIFQELLRKGFSLPSADEKAFTTYVTKELKNLGPDNPQLKDIAAKFNISPLKLYNNLQHTAVWQFGDILNVARVIERMNPGLLKKGMSLDDAMKETEKYSLQYKVPSRVGGKLLPGKLGRSASKSLQSPVIFFGRYKYDLYKIMANTIKDTINMKTLVTDPKSNVDAVGKLAAMSVGAGIVWQAIDKGLQNVTGNKNAYIKAPGALELPEAIEEIANGKRSLTTTASNQLYISGVVTIPLQIQNNHDNFTGKVIYDPNASHDQQVAQIGKWLESQVSFGQKATELSGSKGNKVLDTLLAISGTNLPKNSTAVSKLYSLQYDSLPGVQADAKSLAKKGNVNGAEKVISDYDKLVMAATKQAYTQAGKTPPSDTQIIKKLKKAGTYYAPKPKTIRSWKTKAPSNAKSLLGL